MGMTSWGRGELSGDGKVKVLIKTRLSFPNKEKKRCRVSVEESGGLQRGVS